tara:strand:+ start:484 stop:1209 length:726 start_codon:yes stop_codon:yes gene_type:complete
MKLSAFLKKLATVYLVFIHVLIAILLIKTNFFLLAGKTLGVTPAEEFHAQLYQNLFEKTEAFRRAVDTKVILIGDSLSTKIPAEALPENTLNLAIGGLTTKGAERLIGTIAPVDQGVSYIVELGVNDLKYRQPSIVVRDIQELVAVLSETSKVTLIGLLPVDMKNAKVQERAYLKNMTFRQINAELSAFCNSLTQCSFLDTQFLADEKGNLREEYSVADGWHLSFMGASILGAEIQKALNF